MLSSFFLYVNFHSLSYLLPLLTFTATCCCNRKTSETTKFSKAEYTISKSFKVESYDFNGTLKSQRETILCSFCVPQELSKVDCCSLFFPPFILKYSFLFCWHRTSFPQTSSSSLWLFRSDDRLKFQFAATASSTFDLFRSSFLLNQILKCTRVSRLNLFFISLRLTLKSHHPS